MVKILSYSVFFLLALIFFIPKVSVYYMAEQELLKHQVILSNETVSDNGLSLSLENIDISYDSVESLNVKEADMSLFILYNTASMTNIEFSEFTSSFIPAKVESIDVKYTVFQPFTLFLHSEGEFGEAQGSINLSEMKVSISLTPSELMQNRYANTLRKLHKNEDGSYTYEKTL